MQALFGKYQHKLDAKGRIAMPAKFRKVLPNDLMVVLAPKNECLFVYDVEGFQEWMQTIFEDEGGYRPSNSDHRRRRAILNSCACDVEIDGAGRIGLPAGFRDDAGLQKDVVLIGNTDRLEIWDAAKWDEFCGDDDLSGVYA